MKKKVLTLTAVALVALMAAACHKERRCSCVIEDVATTYNPVLVIDDGLHCDDITEMALEEKYVTEDGVHSLHRTEVHKVTCSDQR